MLVDVDGEVRLGVESLGDTDAPALLLVAGGGWSMDWWDDDLCARLVDRGLRVIRYDHRDTGVSTTWPAGSPGYTGRDLMTDAVAVLDACGAGRAHVAGLSMGGGIAQRLAIEFPDRVAALTLIATTALGPAGDDLPGPTPAIEAVLAGEGPEVSDPVEALVEGERPFAGPGAFDEARTRAIATRVVARSRDVAAAGNHFMIEPGPMGPIGLGALAGVPTLVVHGGADPLFPPEHGRALAAAIPGARLLELPGMGHQLPPPDTWDELVDALLALHTHH